MVKKSKAVKRRLIVCLDGTWNEPEEKSEINHEYDEPTNVLKIVRGVKPVDAKGVPQITYYHTGVGTGGLLDKIIGGLTGIGLSHTIMEAYRFIANNYEPGDEIFLFGFSRGAYSVRALAGFIGTVGMLKKEHLAYLPDAYDYYRTAPKDRKWSNGETALINLEHFPKKDIPIEFIGVWDTVGALGAPTPLLKRLTRYFNLVGFHDTSLGTDVRHAFHALAISERRRSFSPDLWTSKEDTNTDQVNGFAINPAKGLKQEIEQLWFAGVHSNIGGSYKNNILSNKSLKWMVEKAKGCGLAFNNSLTRDLNKIMKKQPVEEARIEDSFSPLYQLLSILPGMSPYIREIGRHQTGEEKRQVGINEGVHPSALEAMDKTFFITDERKYWKPKNLLRAHARDLEDAKEAIRRAEYQAKVTPLSKTG